jgi:hypothetical protein
VKHRRANNDDASIRSDSSLSPSFVALDELFAGNGESAAPPILFAEICANLWFAQAELVTPYLWADYQYLIVRRSDGVTESWDIFATHLAE